MRDEKRCLILGYGSVGARHCAVLREQGHRVACVSARNDLPIPRYESIKAALDDFRPQAVIVARSTNEHLDICLELAALDYQGLVLVEKPLWGRMPPSIPRIPYEAYVAYNMRFHPVVRRIREKLAGRRVYSAQLTVGQYLPDWRPGTDYRQCYSADAQRGGGVLRDLSHELDLALWLFGPWEKATARIGRWGKLAINSEDTVDILATCENCPSLTIHLDYQNLFLQRHIMIQAEGLSLYGDLTACSLRSHEGTEMFEYERNMSFHAQARAFLYGDTSMLCSWEEGAELVRFIERLEHASKHEQWAANI